MTHIIVQNNMMGVFHYRAYNFASAFADTLHTVDYETFTALVVVPNIDVGAVPKGLDST